MKTMNIILATSMALAMVACNEKNTYVPSRDWDNTTYYFATSDEPNAATYYKPYNGYVGDPMPYYDPVSKRFIVAYLQDYRPNPAGTYHPIWGVTTQDAAHYESLGEVIECGGLYEQDAAIGTGSVIYAEEQGLYYFFYTGNKYEPGEKDNAQAVQYATSPDFKTWTKNPAFVMRGNDYGYSRVDFRDPFVFKGDDGKYHMIVSTRSSKGVLAEFVSDNLQDWTCAGDFMSMMWDRFYECPDVFKMGDWWYLVYSEQHSAVRKVQYFKGKTLEELKKCTKDDAGLWPDNHEGFLDGRGFYAGKTASDGTNRYIWGWCPTRKGKDNTATGSDKEEPEWAGNLVAHRLIQHEDGTLTLGAVEAIDAKYNETAVCNVMRKQGEVSESNGAYTLSGVANVLFTRLGYHNHIHLKVVTEQVADVFGISLLRGTEQTTENDSTVCYSIKVKSSGDQRYIDFDQEGDEAIGNIGYIDSYRFNAPADKTYNIDIYTDNSIVVMYINDVVCWTNRIYGVARNCWSVNTYNGAITVSDIKVTKY